MNRRVSLLISLFAISCVLSSCNGKHEHVDNNHDHYCDVCNEKISDHEYSTNPHECDICHEITHCFDNDINGECDICHESWPNETKVLFNTHLGELLPYFKVSTNFEEKLSYIEATIEGDATKYLVAEFLATTKYTSLEVPYLDKTATCLSKNCDTKENYKVDVLLIYNSATNITFVDAYLSPIQQSNFPIDLVKKCLNGHTSENIIIPDDGTVFLFEEGNKPGYCMVTYNGSAESYLIKLKNAGYYLDYSMIDYYLYPAVRALSSGRTLAINVTDKTSEVTIEFMGVDAPNETQWSDLIKSYQMTLFNEVLPFPNASFNVDKEVADITVSQKGYFQAESYVIDAFKVALEAMRTDSSFKETYEEDGNYYTFSKIVGYYEEKVVISVLWGTTTMSFIKGFPTYTSWPKEQIDYCLGGTYKDNIPAAEGESFYLYYEEAHPNVPNLTVYGTKTNYDNYINSLKSNGYDVTLEKDGWHHALGSEETIEMFLLDATEDGYFKIEIHRFKPEDPLPYFPMEQVLEELDKDAVFTGPIPEGTTFTPSYPYGKIGASDIMITITGGNMTNYTQAVIDAGFVYKSEWSFDNYKAYVNSTTHVVIYIYDTGSNENYKVEYGVYYDV